MPYETQQRHPQAKLKYSVYILNYSVVMNLQKFNDMKHI